MPVPPLSTVVLLSKERKGRLAPLPRTGWTGATLRLGGFDTGMAAFDHAGLVAFGGSGGTTLSVAGNYVGHDGTLVVNTVLGDDHSKTDLLKIAGDTSGATNVQVINLGGAGAPTVNGIKLVDVSGQSNGKFSLLGDYVTRMANRRLWQVPMPTRCIKVGPRPRMATGICAARREREPSSRMRCRASVGHPALSGRGADHAGAQQASQLAAAWAVAIGTMPPCLPRRSKPAAAWSVVVKFGPGRRWIPAAQAGRRNRHDSGHHHLALADGRGPPTPRRSGRSADRRPYRAVRQCVVEDLDRERRRPHAYQGLGRGRYADLAGNNGFMWMARRRPCGTRTPSIRPRSAGSWPRASRASAMRSARKRASAWRSPSVGR